MLYSYRLGGDECQGENKLVPSNGTYLCSMQGHICRITTLGGKSPPGKKEIKLRRISKNGSTWLDMREAWAIWLKRNVSGLGIKLNKASKAHDNAFTTLHEGVLGKWTA